MSKPVTEAMLRPALTQLLNELHANNWVSIPTSYASLYYSLFNYGEYNTFGSVHARIIGEVCLEWERKNQNAKTIDYILPQLRERQTKGEWHSDIDHKLDTTLENAERRGKAIAKALGVNAGNSGYYFLRVARRFSAEQVAKIGFAKAVETVATEGQLRTITIPYGKKGKTRSVLAFTK